MNKNRQGRLFALLKLVRAQNLLMIAFTQLLLKYFVLHKVLRAYGLEPEMGDWLFFTVVLSTVMIAAGGYVINDYFDVKTDMINHPDTVVVDTVIGRRWAIILHIVLTVGGVLLGMFAALKTGYLRLAIPHVAAALILWFYSTTFKRQLLSGNIAVALLTSAIIFMPFIYEMAVMQRVNPGFFLQYKMAVFTAIKYAWIYASFAFVTTLAREIVKDLEDREGDEATGCRTLPIVFGSNSARITAFFLLLITAILLMFVVYNTMRWQNRIISTSTLYILFLLIIPSLALAGYVLRSVRVTEYKKASIALKLLMLSGLSYSFIFYYS